jgi:hypothetical protein
VAERGPDMRPQAVAARLREIGRLLSQRGFQPKGADMSIAAVTARLKMLGSLSDACRRLGRARL